MPREGWIAPLGFPLTSTKYHIVVIHIIINEIHILWNSNCLIIASKQDHSTLSKALLMSSFMATSPFPFLV